MKSFLKITALLFSIALPGAFALEFVVGPAAAAVNSQHVFVGFVAALVALIMFNDYARPARRGVLLTFPRASAAGRPLDTRKSEHPLAA